MCCSSTVETESGPKSTLHLVSIKKPMFVKATRNAAIRKF